MASRSYQTAMTPRQSKKISFREAAKFFTTYISKDMSRKLYEAFIAIADRHRDGVFNGDCIYLSLQMSRALDFAKTGMYATINRDLIQYPFPDFMRQRPLKTYTSSTPLGSIYRTTQSMYERPLSNTHCYYDTRLYVQDMYKYIIQARKMKAKYDHSLRILLGQYSVKTEVEFISGHIIEYPKYLNEQYRPQFLERIQAAYVRFRKYWKQVFDVQWANNDTNGQQPSSSTSFSSLSSEEKSAEIEAKAAAWYYVTYHPSEFKSDTIYSKTMQRYMSFPWVVESHLIYIAHKNDSRPNLREYSQPIPAEKMEHHARLHRGPQAETIFAESNDETSSEEEENDTDNENLTHHHQQLNSYGLDLPRHPQEMDPHHHEDVDEVPVITVKLADLLDL